MILCWKSPLVCSVFIFIAFPDHASSSAIPMWEFLSRNEKINHLFNTFAKQATEFCKSSNMADCNKILLMYGLMNLAGMDDENLDKMDPYQRGANDLIWESVIGRSRKTPFESNKDKENIDQNYYVDALETSTNENDLGFASSNNVEEVSENSDYSRPMLVRIYPDGSPVLDDKSPVVKDEDLAEHIAMRESSPFTSDFVKHNYS